MEWWEALILGVVQGLTEFLPISSSGHLLVVQDMLGIGLPDAALDAFDVALHLGTLVAVVSYFRADLARMAGAAVRVCRTRRIETIDERLAVYVVVGTVPAIIAYALLGDIIQRAQDNFTLVGIMLVSVCAVFAAADRRTKTRGLEEFNVWHAIIVGCAQAAALIPGTSRSGATISAGMLMGFERSAAARFAFLMSVPVIIAATVLTLPDLAHVGGQDSGFTGAVLIGCVAAAISGYAAIAGLLRFLGGHALSWFSLYRIPVGLGLIFLYAR